MFLGIGNFLIPLAVVYLHICHIINFYYQQSSIFSSIINIIMTKIANKKLIYKMEGERGNVVYERAIHICRLWCQTKNGMNNIF